VVEEGFCIPYSLDWLRFSGPASLALDSIEVRCAGNSGVGSEGDGIIPDAVRYCDEANGRPCMFPEIAGGAKVKAAVGGVGPAALEEKFGEN